MNFLRFKTDKFFYIYDINTNHILKVDNCLWRSAGIKDVNDPRAEQLLKGFGASQRTNSLAKIRELQEKHNVLADRLPLKGLSFPKTVDEVVEELNSKLDHIILNLTERCNFRCSYCKFGVSYGFADGRYSERMPEAVALRAIDFLVERNAQGKSCRVGFYGGEPLLAFPMIKQLVEYAKIKSSKPVKFALTTNGSLLTIEILKFLIRHDFSLTISLDGPERLHDRYRRTVKDQPTFDTILRHINVIKSADPHYYERKVGFSVVLAPPYHLLEVIDFFSDDSVYTEAPVFFSLVDPNDTTFYDQFDKREIRKEYGEQIEILKQELLQNFIHAEDGKLKSKRAKVISELLGKRYFSVHNRAIFPLGEFCYPNGVCTPGLQRSFVTVRGELGVCERMGESWIIGDVFRGFSRWAIAELITTYVKISSEKCSRCWAVRLCTCCYLDARKGEGLSIEKKEQMCGGRKKNLAQAMIEYCRVMELNPHAFDSIKSDLGS